MKKVYQGHKAFLSFALLGLIVLPYLAFAGSNPAFWQAKSKSATVFLLGSMHFGHERFYPLPNAVNQAFSVADTLIVEVDITNIDPMAAMSAIMRHARLEEGKTLTDVLSEDTVSLLNKQAKAIGIPLVSMQSFKPWFAALQLVEGELRKTEFKQQYGIDQYFLNKAKGKDVLALETLDAQLGLFGTLSLAEQEIFLLQTLKEFSDSHKYLNALATQWEEGDVKALEQSLLAPFQNGTESQKLYQVVFSDRNTKMTAAAITHLQQTGVFFMVVGAGHLVGDEGVVARLKRSGYQVERIQASSQLSLPEGRSMPARELETPAQGNARRLGR